MSGADVIGCDCTYAYTRSISLKTLRGIPPSLLLHLSLFTGASPPPSHFVLYQASKNAKRSDDQSRDGPDYQTIRSSISEKIFQYILKYVLKLWSSF